jgi:WD40 repeat protein
LVLTASSAPGDGRVRLWDVRTGPRETAAALGGHVGGVTAVSPSPNGQAGSGGAFFTGEFLLEFSY